MAHAVFLRAVNVGGHGVTGVADLARKLGMRNIGAAGTFVAPKGSPASLRKAIRAELPDVDIMIVPAEEVIALVEAAPLEGEEGKPFVVVLAREPQMPELPVEQKGARLLAVRGVFALALVLPGAKPGTSPTALVERALGVAGTTRGWPTMERVAQTVRELP
jgi:uncharacterized protein (DUF1697 family)